MTREGNWNLPVWEYDQIHTKWRLIDKWEKVFNENFIKVVIILSKIIFFSILKPSRHLSGCCLGDDLYMLGGFGRHRVTQELVYKYSLKDGKFFESRWL